MKNNKEYNILVGGAAGEGSRLAGLTIARLFESLGWYVSIFEDYQSLIKGGHNFSKIRATKEYNSAPREQVDYIVALNKETFDKHLPKLSKDGIVIYNSDFSDFKYGYGISGKEILEKFKCKPIMKNLAFLGALGKVLGVPWKELEKVFKTQVKKELELNLKIAKYGYDCVDQLEQVEKLKSTKTVMTTGNEAIARASVKAGLEVFCAYPMTPATSILHHLAAEKDEFKLKIMQAENEIAVVMATLGSAYAGKRTMSATSGGGIALMTEGVSMAGMAEIPMVIVESQRPGPATGIPTYSGQGDLDLVTNIGHGDLVRLVLTPGDAEECIDMTGLALNYAWKYQMPVILLVDKDLSEGTYTIDSKAYNRVKPGKALLWDGKGEYGRYKITKDGISPMAFPGNKKAIVKATSYEHDEYGITIEEEVDKIVEMQNDRLNKYKTLEKDLERLELVKVYGKKNAKTAIMAWGSPKGAVIEAAEILGAKVIQPLCAQPFPAKQFVKAMKGVQKLIAVEANATGQMSKILRANEIKVDSQILKYDGRPITVDELVKKLSSKIKK